MIIPKRGDPIVVQLHKRFTDEQIKELIEKYLRKEITRSFLQEILGIGKTRFFALVGEHRRDSLSFSIRYRREKKTRSISKDIEKNIFKELATEKTLIENKDVPIRSYNYSYIKDQLAIRHQQHVSLPTIIDRAKKSGFYLKKPQRSVHDREVLTHYAGELIQHDSSHHLWAPNAGEKWYLITSLDDFSRFIFYAQLFKRETSWAHILSLESLMLKYGFPFSYYVDSHSIFRFVQGRDSVWREHHLVTDEANPQWKQVLHDCNVKIIYALSPQAKGKSKDRISGFRTDWFVPVSERMLLISDRPRRFSVRKSTNTIIAGSFYNTGSPLYQAEECFG
jgi:hypothetical protein